MAPPKSAYEIGMEKLFKDSRPRKYPKNQLIHYQGDPMSHVFLVKSGYLKAYTILDSGDTRTILLLSPGDIFPIAFSVSMDWTQYQLRYFYQTLSDVEVEVMDRDVLKNEIESDLAKLNAYMAYVSASNQIVLNQLEVMKNKKAINKVEMLLPYLAQKLGEEIKPKTYRLKLKLSHQEIADLSGVTRETTTTLVKQLEKDGVIEQTDGTWIIHMEDGEGIFANP